MLCSSYSISQEISTRFSCALLCCGYAIVHNEFTSSIYPYSSGLLCWHWGNRYRRAANPQKVLYLRSLMHPPPPTHLVCNNHRIANFLSFDMSLAVVLNCGAANALHGFEISMFYFFLKLYFIHISKDILPLRAQNAIKQCK